MRVLGFKQLLKLNFLDLRMNIKFILYFIIITNLDFFSQVTSLTVKLRFEYTYISSAIANDGSGLSASNGEPVFKLYVMPDIPNMPSSGWMAGQCFYQQFNHSTATGYSHGWIHSHCPLGSNAKHGHPGSGAGNSVNNNFDPLIFNETFDINTGFPVSLKLYLIAWEDDGCGPTCEFNTCNLTEDDYYEAEYLGSFDFKSWGPPCNWNGGTYMTSFSNFYTTSNNYGVSVTSYYEYNESDNLTHYWLGEKNNNWFTECNWSTKHVPDNNDDVIIPFPLPSTSGVLPRIYANSSANGQAAGQAYCNTIQVESGAMVTIESGAKLNVTQ